MVNRTVAILDITLQKQLTPLIFRAGLLVAGLSPLVY